VGDRAPMTGWVAVPALPPTSARSRAGAAWRPRGRHRMRPPAGTWRRTAPLRIVREGPARVHSRQSAVTRRRGIAIRSSVEHTMPSLRLRSRPVADLFSQNSANRACVERLCRAFHSPTVRCHRALPRHGHDLLAPGDRGGAGAGGGALIVGCARGPCCVTLRPTPSHYTYCRRSPAVRPAAFSASRML
jgi:hypothetical protein